MPAYIEDCFLLRLVIQIEQENNLEILANQVSKQKQTATQINREVQVHVGDDVSHHYHITCIMPTDLYIGLDILPKSMIAFNINVRNHLFKSSNSCLKMEKQ
ncbi:unnamed protein product [Gordionus sp. m RMFG-2023]